MEEGEQPLTRFIYKGLYMNIDGLTESKFGELESILNRDRRIIFLFASEVKQQRNMVNMETDIEDFSTHEYLRDSSATGGIILWTRQNTGKAVRPWYPNQEAPAWMSSERVWVMMEDSITRIACCGVYLRTESPKSSTFFKNNEELLTQLVREKIELEHNGYHVCFLGDFNARISPDIRFDFQQYPHAPNNNGTLVNSFANTINLHCMNPMSWNGVVEEQFTYQRDLGIRYDRSIIDYGIATPTTISLTTRFSVQVSYAHITSNPILFLIFNSHFSP